MGEIGVSTRSALERLQIKKAMLYETDDSQTRVFASAGHAHNSPHDPLSITHQGHVRTSLLHSCATNHDRSILAKKGIFMRTPFKTISKMFHSFGVKQVGVASLLVVLCLSLLMVAPLQAHAATPPHLVACDGSENLRVQYYATGEDDGKTFITGPYDICFSGTGYAGTGDLGISPLTGVTLIYYSWNNSDDGWLRLYKEPGGGGSWQNMNPAEYISSPDGSFLLTQMCLSCGARPDNNP